MEVAQNNCSIGVSFYLLCINRSFLCSNTRPF